jgi:hypothetical protein
LYLFMTQDTSGTPSYSPSHMPTNEPAGSSDLCWK